MSCQHFPSMGSDPIEMRVHVPKDVDAHLRNEYYKWDYMQLPPESARHPTHTFSYHFPWWIGPTKIAP